MSKVEIGGWQEWLWPSLFLICMAWTLWHMPAFILDLLPFENQSLYGQIAALHESKQVTPNLPGLFGGFADSLDWLAVVLIPVFFWLGSRNIAVAPMEFQDWKPWDRPALFLGRVTMIMILGMTGVMLYEVFMRYVISDPTLWGNELTLWIAGFIFLVSGFYAMQQRCHIRIFLLYDVVPRWLQKTFDTLTVLFICIFAFGLVFGSYTQVFVNKFYRWEMFGTAFDPPIPATVQPAILILVVLIALQSIANLIADWNREPESHSAADDIDEEELEAIKRSVGGN